MADTHIPVALGTYNEAENVTDFQDRVLGVVPKALVLVVDGVGNQG